MQNQYKKNYEKTIQDTALQMNMEKLSGQTINSQVTFDYQQHQKLRKSKSSFHLLCLFGTIIFYSSIIIIDQLLSVYIIMLFYSFYLLCSIPCGDVISIINNMRSYEQYKKFHQLLIQKKGHFVFNSKCFHYQGQKVKMGQKEKKITRQQTQKFQCKQSIDMSGRLINQQEVRNFCQITYSYDYQFYNNESKNRLLKSYKEFKKKYNQDQNQQYDCIFQIQGFQSGISFRSSQNKINHKVIFLITSFLGLALFYACIFERLVSRYEIKLKKKVKVQ